MIVKLCKGALLILCVGFSLFSCKMPTAADKPAQPAPPPAPTTYSLTGAVSGSGTISVQPSDASGTSISTSYLPGTSVTITALPDTGYQFLRWEGDVTGSSVTQVFPIAHNMSVTAVFADSALSVYNVTVNVNPAGAGTVSPGSGKYVANATPTFTYVANAGCSFLNWTGGGATASYTPAPITADTTITANFEKLYSITTSAVHGTITLNPQKAWYKTGDTVAVSVTPNTGYAFTGWTGGLSGTLKSTTVTVGTSNITIGANIVERWTILIHLAVDNNIDYSFEKNSGIITNYLATLEAVEAADTANVFDICVLMDSYANTDPKGTSYTSTFTDGYYKLSGGAFSADRKVTTGEINSGSVQTTKSFIDWAYANSSGKRVMYSVFNHGSGFDDQTVAGTYGIGYDDSNNDCLTHSELAQTTAYLKTKAGKNIDLFYSYACLMGGVELAWELRNSVDVLLSSEETFPAEKWSYEALNAIVANPGISAADLAKAFCDSAYLFFSPISMNRTFTLAAYDLSKVQPLYNAINSFALAATNWIGNDSTRAQKLDNAVMASLQMSTPYYTDLGIFMDQVDTLVGGFSSQTSAVRTAINNMIIYKKTFASTTDQATIDFDDASGISIFHNIWRATIYNIFYSPATYQNVLSFGATNAWTSYANKMNTLRILPITPAKDAYEPDGPYDPINNTLTAGLANAQSHTFHLDVTEGPDQDFMRVYLTAGTTYTFQTFASSTPSDTCLYLYNPSYMGIMANEDISPTNKYSKITYTATATGYHYLCVYDRKVSFGNYKIYFDTGTWGPTPEPGLGPEYNNWTPKSAWNGTFSLKL